MPRKTLHYYLLKLARLSGWLLLPLVIIYIGTGFALCGKLGFSQWIDLQTALAIHQLFDWPLVGLFLLHATITSYFAMRRWGWIKNRKQHCRKVSPAREALKFGLTGLACAACGGAGIYYVAEPDPMGRLGRRFSARCARAANFGSCGRSKAGCGRRGTT